MIHQLIRLNNPLADIFVIGTQRSVRLKEKNKLIIKWFKIILRQEFVVLVPVEQLASDFALPGGWAQ